MPEPEASEGAVVRCDACPVLCRIRPGRTGACDRYANHDGRLVRLDPLLVIGRRGAVVPFLARAGGWDRRLISGAEPVVTGLGAGTTYPDYKPAPFIVGATWQGVDTVTVVSEAMFDYCGVKVKIDTERVIGPEGAAVRCEGEVIGHVTTPEYNSQMLSLGGVRLLTESGKRRGEVVCGALLGLCNRRPVALAVEGGATLVVQAGAAPVIDGVAEGRMPVGSGSAAIGMFARQFHGHADEVIVIDEHSTGVLSEHQAGRLLGMRPSGVRVRGRRSPTGRYLGAARPGRGWGGTDLADPLKIVRAIDPGLAWPGLRLLFVGTTGEEAAFYLLDEKLAPRPAPLPAPLAAVVARIKESSEPARASVLFMAGAGGSLRAGVTEHPIRLTRAVKEGRVRVSCGGAPAYVWPGGGITIMVDVEAMPENAFGTVPTPALVAPIEFTMTAADYAALGGHVGRIVPLEAVPAGERVTSAGAAAGEDGDGE